MILNQNTEMMLCRYLASDIPLFVRFVQFDFMSIRKLENLPFGSYVGKQVIHSVLIDIHRFGFRLRFHRYCNGLGT